MRGKDDRWLNTAPSEMRAKLPPERCTPVYHRRCFTRYRTGKMIRVSRTNPKPQFGLIWTTVLQGGLLLLGLILLIGSVQKTFIALRCKHKVKPWTPKRTKEDLKRFDANKLDSQTNESQGNWEDASTQILPGDLFDFDHDFKVKQMFFLRYQLILK